MLVLINSCMKDYGKPTEGPSLKSHAAKVALKPNLLLHYIHELKMYFYDRKENL